MGLIRAARETIGNLMADQWREYFYCNAMSNDVLAVKGQKRVNNNKKNNRYGNDNIISNGSIIAVNEGQCMMIVDQGMVVEFCADPGEFEYDMSTEPSLFYGDFGESLEASFRAIGKRFSFGGVTPKDQRVYYFNIKEILSNLFGTANPIPFRVVDQNIGLDVDISIRCNGEYSFKITDPLLFYKNVCGNVADSYMRSQISGQLKSELMTALQPAFARISAMGIRYSAVPAHTMELASSLNEVLSDKWSKLRGIEIVSMNLNSLKASEEDERMIKDIQKTAVYRNPGMAAATLSTAQAEAMKAAASNKSTGPVMAFAGMNAAGNVGGMNAGDLFRMEAQNQSAQNRNGNKQEQAGAANTQTVGWTCSCGTVNKGKFCMECGAKKPDSAQQYKCDKCGWEPEDSSRPPKFCPECGDVFDNHDLK